MTNTLIAHDRADRTQLRQIIAALDDGVIVIDPDQTIEWANASALAMHGVDTLAQLGHDVDDYRTRFEIRYRNNHVVPPGQTPLDRVVMGEAFSEILVEVGRPGEERRWTHRLRSLVLSRPDGKPDCLVLIINDETERFEAEARFEKTFAANPAPAIICRLSDLRYVKVNVGFMEMTGFVAADLIGRLLYDVDVLDGADRRALAVERLREGRTIPQMEATIRVADGTTRLVIVGGQPIDMGDDACMLFTFADLEGRRRAEEHLRQSEERFSKMFRMAPSPMIVSTREDCRTIDVNDAFCAMTGLAVQEAVGRTEPEIDLWEDAASRRLIRDALRAHGLVSGVEMRLRRKDGSLADVLVSADIVHILGEACVLTVMQDNAVRRQSQLDLMAAIDAVMQDTTWFSQKVIEKLANLAGPDRRATLGAQVELSAREREVLSEVSHGRADREIAEKLGLSASTVRNHVGAIYAKIGVNRRAAAVVWGRERGFDGGHPDAAASGKRLRRSRA